MRVEAPRLQWSRVASVAQAAIESQEDGRGGRAGRVKFGDAVGLVCAQLGIEPAGVALQFVEAAVQHIFDAMKARRERKHQVVDVRIDKAEIDKAVAAAMEQYRPEWERLNAELTACRNALTDAVESQGQAEAYAKDLKIEVSRLTAALAAAEARHEMPADHDGPPVTGHASGDGP